MKRTPRTSVVAAAVVCICGALAFADVAVVIEHQYTIGNNNFSAFAYNSLLDPHQFITTGYGYGKDVRWSNVLDDSIEPWEMEGDILMDSTQIEFFARDGFASYSLTYNAWGMNFNPLDSKYFITCISSLKDPASGDERLDNERDLIQFDPLLPNGGSVMPSGVSVTSTGLLTDSALGSGTGFVSSGVAVGDKLTLYPLHFTAQIYSTTYTVSQVINETTLQLDDNPLWAGAPTQSDTVSYILMMQPWVTLGAFRDNIPYYVENPTKGPKAHNKGGLSPDGTTLYLGDVVSDNLIAVDTQVPETFSVLTSKAKLEAHIEALTAAGRKHPIVNPDRAYVDSSSYLGTRWTNWSSECTWDYGITDPAAPVGTKCMEARFTEAGAKLRFHSVYDDTDPEESPRYFDDYSSLAFWIHGGVDGGQEMTVTLYDIAEVPGNIIPVAPLEAGVWNYVEIPIEQFGSMDTIGDIVFNNTADDGQPKFYLDDVGLRWTDPLPPGVGDYVVEDAGMASAQLDCDAEGRVWFAEDETDDIVWTTDGVTLNTFLTSNEIVAAYIEAGTLEPSGYFISNGVQVLGMIRDPMGTVYWSDNQSRSIWKAPAKNAGQHIIQLASKAEIQEALELGTSSPRGLGCFSIRGQELLTYNFVDSNTVYKVDLNTFDYGDFDGDFDADLDDYNLFFTECLAGPGVSTPPGSCTQDQFDMADLDNDGDVDINDFKDFQSFFTGAN